MHHANHFYGHAKILARYCGYDADLPRIRGFLQHGWNIVDGFAPGMPYVPGVPRFLWSSAPIRRGLPAGHRNAIAIGAPWLYLLALEPDPGLPRRGTIWYPFHGWEQQEVLGDHSALIAEIRETEPEEVTVCLYWAEYGNPAVRRLYEDEGFRVICHGYRGHWWHRVDPRFLYRQLAELRRHRRVASNRLSSAIFYGVAAGCEPAVYGDPMVLKDEHPVFGGVARIRRLWPDLHGPTLDLVVARHLTAQELGAPHMTTPAELRHLFHWPTTPSPHRSPSHKP
jgi:hypothetical protein